MFGVSQPCHFFLTQTTNTINHPSAILLLNPQQRSEPVCLKLLHIVSPRTNYNHSDSSCLTVSRHDIRVAMCVHNICLFPSTEPTVGSAGERVCISVLLFLISQSERQLTHRWLQGLYFPATPSWCSLAGLEMFGCQRFNLLKGFTCHFWRHLLPVKRCRMQWWVRVRKR